MDEVEEVVDEVEEVVDVDVGTETEDIEEEVEVCEFLYKKKMYYYEKDDCNNIVYNNSDLEVKIGRWGVTKSGKMKFIKDK